MYWLFLQTTITVVLTEGTAANLLASCRSKAICFLSCSLIIQQQLGVWCSEPWCSRESASSPPCSLCWCISLFVKLSNASFSRPGTKSCHQLESCRILKRFPSPPWRVSVLKFEPPDAGKWAEMCQPWSCYHLSRGFSLGLERKGLIPDTQKWIYINSLMVYTISFWVQLSGEDEHTLPLKQPQ